MAKIRVGYCVYFDAATQSADLLPLLECLGYAIERNRPVDFFLKGIVAREGGPSGGDPGWAIDWVQTESDALFPEEWQRCMAQLAPSEDGCYEAWTDPSVSMLDPPYAYYPRQVVRHHVNEALGNFRIMHPERGAEVDEAIKRLKLPENSALATEPKFKWQLQSLMSGFMKWLTTVKTSS